MCRPRAPSTLARNWAGSPALRRGSPPWLPRPWQPSPQHAAAPPNEAANTDQICEMLWSAGERKLLAWRWSCSRGLNFSRSFPAVLSRMANAPSRSSAAAPHPNLCAQLLSRLGCLSCLGLLGRERGLRRGKLGVGVGVARRWGCRLCVLKRLRQRCDLSLSIHRCLGLHSASGGMQSCSGRRGCGCSTLYASSSALALSHSPWRYVFHLSSQDVRCNGWARRLAVLGRAYVLQVGGRNPDLGPPPRRTP
jgi:hypothetical protein